MGVEGRRFFEPRSLFDRIVYALLALMGPGAVVSTCVLPELRWASAILAAWCAITLYYTIEWAILSYRRWRGTR